MPARLSTGTVCSFLAIVTKIFQINCIFGEDIWIIKMLFTSSFGSFGSTCQMRWQSCWELLLSDQLIHRQSLQSAIEIVFIVVVEISISCLWQGSFYGYFSETKGKLQIKYPQRICNKLEKFWCQWQEDCIRYMCWGVQVNLVFSEESNIYRWKAKVLKFYIS